MKCRNLHCHPIDIYMMKNKKFCKETTLSKYSYLNPKIKLQKNLFAFKCKECQDFNNDYRPNYIINEKNCFYPSEKEVAFSLFCLKDSFNLYNTQETKCFKLFEFENTTLIGTREEIISHICEEYNSLKEQIKKLDSTNEAKEKNIKKIKDDLDNVKKEKNILYNNLVQEKKFTSELNTEMTKINNKLDNITSENDENIKKVLEQNKKNEELEEFIKQREDTIKEVNESLIKEKNINQNISENLNLEKEKNKQLNDKLDNMTLENDENMKKVLQKLESEKEANQNLQSKYSELEKQQQLKHKEKEELESQLKLKDEELQNAIKNFSPEHFGLKFESDSKTGEYDIVLDITSIRDLINKGWIVKYNREEGKQKYLNKKDEPTIVAGVIGNGNKGKSFFLEKLSGYKIPKGFNVKTEGLSIRFGTS